MSTLTTVQHDQQHSAKNSSEALDGLSVEDYIALPRFNRTLTYHSSVTNGEVTASYAIAGTQSTDALTFIYVGGLAGGRLHSLWIDYFCKTKNVRGIFVDRPGLGAFTAVRIEQRTTVWLEAVPLILADARADKVCLVALSGGAPYAFNLLWHHPNLIRTDLPIFLLSPWVHPSCSGVKFNYWMSWVPTSVARGAGRVATMAVKQILANYGSKAKMLGNEAAVPATCGATCAQVQQHRTLFSQKIFSEDMSGSTEDYLLGIKNPTRTWGICPDYQIFVAWLAKRCKESHTRLRFCTWFATGDRFIGAQGIKYFNDVFSSPLAQEGFDYHSEMVDGVSHERICYPENGVIGRMLAMALEAQAEQFVQLSR